MLLTALALQCAVLLGIRFYFVRFVFPLLAMTLPWMASGLDRLIVAALSLSAKFRSHGSAHLATAGALLLAAALCVSSHPRVAAASEFAESSDAPLKAGGSWIHVHPRVNERRRRPVVMGYSAVLSFYADATLSYLPYTEDEARALRYVHWISPDYIVLRPEDVAQSPYIAHWLQSGVPDSCAHLAHTTPEDRGPLVIYEWTCPTS